MTATLCAAHPGLLLERKSVAVALHYRLAPALEAECLAAMTFALEQLPDMTLMRGKQVLELKPRAAGKDAAVHAFLAEAPFHGRQPWFFGDDVTDESVFAIMPDMGGEAFSVARKFDGLTAIFDSPASVRAALTRLANSKQ